MKSRLAMRSSLERFDRGAEGAAVPGEAERAAAADWSAAPGWWAGRGGRSALPVAATAAAALLAVDVNNEAAGVAQPWRRGSAEMGAPDFR